MFYKICIYTVLPGISFCSASVCVDCSLFFLAGTKINADGTCNTKKNNYITVTQYLSVVLDVNVH